MTATDHLSAYQFSVLPGRKGGRVAVTHGDSEVGSLKWAPGYRRSDPPMVTSVDVDPGHRSKGLATEMYRQASQHAGQPMAHSAYRTDAAEGWSARVGGHRPDQIRVEDY